MFPLYYLHSNVCSWTPLYSCIKTTKYVLFMFSVVCMCSWWTFSNFEYNESMIILSLSLSPYLSLSLSFSLFLFHSFFPLSLLLSFALNQDYWKKQSIISYLSGWWLLQINDKNLSPLHHHYITTTSPLYHRYDKNVMNNVFSLYERRFMFEKW